MLVTFVFGLAVATVHTTTVMSSTVAPDHLLTVLLAMHNSDTFRHLPASEKTILTELLAAAEVDQIHHYINILGFDRVLTFLDRK